MTATVTILSCTPQATERLGSRLAAELSPGTVVALRGTLGTGKTVLSRGLARGLGIVEPVTSPTFTVVQEYERPAGGWFFHLDMYRIDDAEAALAFGIEEYLFASDGITVVEWPERIAELLADNRPDLHADLVSITLRHDTDHSRAIHLETHTYTLLKEFIQQDPDLTTQTDPEDGNRQ